MPTAVSEQLDLLMRSVTSGDIDLTAKVLTDPDTITPDQERTVAEKLGFKNPLLKFAVDVVSDPVVWVSFLFDRMYPTISWMTGRIPHRFVGAANEFGGVSAAIRPVETWQRGTMVPKLTALQLHREEQVRKIGSRMFDVMRRPKWSEEMPIVSLIMEGQRPAGATPELKRVARNLRKHVDDMWGLLRNTRKVKGGFKGDEITEAWAEPFAQGEAPKYLRDYLPHIPLTGKASTIEMDPAEALRRLGMDRTYQVFQATKTSPKQVWTTDQAQRLSSNFGRYQRLLNDTQGQVYNPHLFKRIRHGIPLDSQQGQELFVTDLNVVLQRYVSSAARTYALNAPLTPQERALCTVYRPDGPPVVPTDDPLIVQTINEGMRNLGARFIEQPIAGTNRVIRRMAPGSENPLALAALQRLTKNMMGQNDVGHFMLGGLFDAVGRKFDQAAHAAGYKEKVGVDAYLRKMERQERHGAVSNMLVSHFYGSTLGLNPWSTIQQFGQPILTTAPAIGLGPALRGSLEVAKRVPQYSRALMAEWRALKASMPMGRLTAPERLFSRMNESAQRAFNSTFPELAKAGLALDPRLFEMAPGSTAISPRMGRAFKSYDDFVRFLLQPFTHGEMANQAGAFYGARPRLKQAIRMGEMEAPVDVAGKRLVGPALDEWLNFEAGQIVNATQFRPGPGGQTLLQSLLPAPLRMFTSFPIRAASFMMESTVRGAMTDKQLETAGLLAKVTGGRNLGALARMVLYGRVAQKGAADILGLDLGRMLGPTAPFTFTSQGEWLAPIPVPPMAGLAVGLVSAAANRDIKEFQPMHLPVVGQVPIPRSLFPAGIGLNRLFKAVQQFEPDMGGFVDENERLMYRGNSTDMVLAAIGLPTEKQRRTRHYIDRVYNIRGRVRKFRRAYAAAWSQYDTKAMTQLESQWQKAFPDWPALNITHRDAKRYQDSARMPLLQRMLQTAGAAGGYLESDIYEADPDLIMPPALPGGLAA